MKLTTFLQCYGSRSRITGDLFAQDCPALDQAENLISLKRLHMVDCQNAKQFRMCLLEDQQLAVDVVTVVVESRVARPKETVVLVYLKCYRKQLNFCGNKWYSKCSPVVNAAWCRPNSRKQHRLPKL
uniref:Uncharacterized protein n=1 Tax=Oryza nivara TaxID=4536 RepID=A0A0E0FG82_ORYNI